MNTKLTLSVDSGLVKKAKSYASEKGRSLSDLVETYFKTITSKKEVNDIEMTYKVKSMLGSFRLPQDVDYKKELADQLNKKYM